MTIEQTRDLLRFHKKLVKSNDSKMAFTMAIKSLDMWDKVKKEIKEIKTTDVNRCKTMTVHIINKHLKEIEE